MKNLIWLPIIILICSACAKPNSSGPQGINLSGVWRACQTDNTNSQLVTITIQGNYFEEVISNYNSVTDCSNSSSGDEILTGAIEFQELGLSNSEPSATDVTLTIDNSDPFGCGINTPAYTYLRIQSNAGFDSAAQIPSCDPYTRGSGLGQYFTKVQ